MEELEPMQGDDSPHCSEIALGEESWARDDRRMQVPVEFEEFGKQHCGAPCSQDQILVIPSDIRNGLKLADILDARHVAVLRENRVVGR
jgi:hypothetical protein